jgi:hypothetical protein
MSTQIQNKPLMPEELFKSVARIYANQFKVLGYKKVAKLVQKEHPQYSVSTKRVKNFFSVKENILPDHILAIDSPIAKKNILPGKLRRRSLKTLKTRKTPLKQRTNITSFTEEDDEDYNPEEEELSEVETDNEVDPNIEEEILSEAEFELNIDIAEVAAVKKTSKKKKKQGKSAKRKSSSKKKKLKTKNRSASTPKAKHSLEFPANSDMLSYAIDDEALYEDIVMEIDLSTAFLGLKN